MRYSIRPGDCPMLAFAIMARQDTSSSDSSSEDENAARFRSVAVTADDISASAAASQEAAKRRHARALQRRQGGGATINKALGGSDGEDDQVSLDPTSLKLAAVLSARLDLELEEVDIEEPTKETSSGDTVETQPFALFTRIVKSKKKPSPTPRQSSNRIPRVREAAPSADAFAQLAISGQDLMDRTREAVGRAGALGPTHWPHEDNCACIGSGAAHIRAVFRRLKRGESVYCPHLEYLGFTAAGIPKKKPVAQQGAVEVSTNPKSVKRRLKRVAERAARRAAAVEAVGQPMVL